MNFAARRVRANRVANVPQEAVKTGSGPRYEGHHAKEKRRPHEQSPTPRQQIAAYRKRDAFQRSR
jgi:hypothetical protein